MSDPGTKSDAGAKTHAIPLSRLFAAPRGPGGPSLADQLAAAVAEGRAAGRAEAEADLLPAIARLEAELSAVRAAGTAELTERIRIGDAAIAAIEAGLSDALADLGLALARRILEAEPALERPTLAALVADALAAAPAGDGGTLRLHPMHRSACPAVPAGWQLQEDAALPPGTVIAEIGPCLSLAGIELRLSQLRAALEEGI